MKMKLGKRVLAFFMSFVMALSIVVCGDAKAADKVKAADIIYDLNRDCGISIKDVTYMSNGRSIQAERKDSEGRPYYTGKEITLKNFKVYTRIGENIIDSKYYTVTYENNLNASGNGNKREDLARIIITGNVEEGCIGEISTTFRIVRVPYSLCSFKINGKQAYYNGRSQIPYAKNGNYDVPLKITYNTKTNGILTLQNNWDYEYGVQNVENIATGDATDVSTKLNGPCLFILSNGDGPNFAMSDSSNQMGEYECYALDVVQADMSKQNITIPEKNIVCTGAALTPEVIVTDGINGKRLEENIDYTLSYTDNVNIGEATVTVTGIGCYKGTQTSTFNIISGTADIKSISDAAVTVPDTSYTGYGIEPKPTVVYNGTTLVEGTDYSIGVYSNNIKPGTASFVISGMGMYTGSKKVEFTIAKRDISYIKLETTDMYYNNGLYPNCNYTISDKESGRVLISGDDYRISRDDSTNWLPGTNYVKVTLKGDYYTGEANFPVTIQKRNMADSLVSITVENQEYTGSPIEAKPTVKLNGRELTEGVDYTLSYKNNTMPGKAAVTVEGIGNFTGTKTVYFNINSSLPNISDAKITINGYYEYTGQQKKPDVTVTYTDASGTTATLTEGTDYTLEYGENINAGKGTVRVVGTGTTYAGAVTKEFNIGQKDIDSSEVTLNMSKTVYPYTGEEVYPEFTLEYNGYTLEEGTDYRILIPTGMDMVGQGEKYVTAYADKGPAKSNYTGMLTIRYTIQGPQGSFEDVQVEELEDFEYEGKAICPTPVMTLDGYNLIAGTDYDIEYSNNTEVGKATIHITGKNTFEGEKYLEFNIVPKDVNNCTISIARNSLPYNLGTPILPVMTTKNGDVQMLETRDYILTAENNIEAGDAKLTVSGVGNYCGSKELEFTITKLSLEGNNTKISNIMGNYAYTGEEVTPFISVIYGLTALTEGKHYELIFENNVDVSTDTVKATVTVRGIGSFEGSQTQEFNITRRDISDCYISPIGVQSWTGSAIEPEITVKLDEESETALVRGTDYTVTYSDNTDAGVATVVIKGINNLQGTINKTFTISKAVYDIADAKLSSVADMIYNFGIPAEPDVTVTYEGKVLSPETDYTLSYTSNINAGTATITVTGKGLYSGTQTVSFEIKPVSISAATVSGIPEEAEYTGDGITFAPLVKLGTVTLKENTDYTVTYNNNKNISTDNEKAKVVIEGKGNYTGTLNREFAIVPKNISSCTISPIDVQRYTGLAVCPSVVVKDGSKTLVKDTDYTVLYSNNTEITTDEVKATVKVTGKGNYTGTLAAEFEIVKPSIADATIKAENVTYTGSAVTTTIVVTLDGEVLEAGIDYEIEYDKATNVEAGTAGFTVKGIGKYQGEKTGSFVIERKNISSYKVSGVTDVTYTGKPITFDLTVEGENDVLVKDTDYIVTYGNNTNVTTKDSKATVKIAGKGNYTGTIEVSFDIAAVDLNNVTITGLNDTAIYTGVGIRFSSMELTYGEYRLVSGVDYNVTYSDNTNVTTAEKPATVTITGIGGFTGTVRHEFAITPKSLDTCSISNIEGQLYTGQAVTPDVVIKDGSYTLVNGKDYEITYSDNTEVTTEGTHAKAVITAKGNYAGSATREFTISYRVIDISGAQIQLTGGDSYEYNFGTAIEPEVKVLVDNQELIKDTDYSVSYADNIVAGEASVIITGKREYKGTVSKKFTITPVDISDGVLNLESEEFEYTGTQIKPVVSGISLEGREITVDESFAISYSSNVSAGTGRVTVTAKAGTCYTGSVTRTFAITPVQIDTADIVVAGQTYTGEEITPIVSVSIAGKKLILNTDYTATYTDNVDAGTATVTITGTGNYAGTSNATFVISSKNIGTSIVTAPDMVYTGKNIVPEITVMNGSRRLTAGTDYEASITNNIEKGTANILITGKGNYTGTVTGSFEIAARDIGDCQIADIEDAVYTGASHTPSVTVSYDDVLLELSRDYTVAYSDNVSVTTNVKKAKAVITGKGNFTGVTTITFDIVPADISGAEVTGIPESMPYTGEEIEISDIEVNASGRKLTCNVDYTTGYTDNTEVGTAGITITGIGAYTGAIDKTFNIVPKNIADCYISDIAGQKYTGNPITPAVTVKNGNIVLVKGKDYDITYINNTDVTTSAEAVITGKGNYTGQITAGFTISRDIVDISAADIADIADMTYNFGVEIKPVPVVKYNQNTLTEGTDYTVSYKNNINAGTATVTITGVGYYSGTKSAVFEILPYSVENGRIVLDADEYDYSGNEITPNISGIAISDTKTISELTSFDIEYRNNVNVGDSAEIIVTAKTGANFTGSCSTTFKIVPVSIEAADVVVADAEYTGSKVTPDVMVSINGNALTLGTDYSVTYADNTNVGTATVTIIGKGNYTGNISGSFKITQKSITHAVVTVPDQKYTGKTLTPDVSVTLDDKLLINGTDYTISYSDNTNVGNAVVVVSGIGNYKDTVSGTFRITATGMSELEVMPIASVTYTGLPITPAVSVYDGEGNSLVPGTDYDVLYRNNINVTGEADKAEAVITGKGNYSGSITARFDILPASISGANVTGYSEIVTYTGKAVTFDGVTVSLAGNVLDTDDYQITYTGNVNPGEDGDTYFTVSGKGNYTGSIVCYFSIARKDLSECTVEEIEGQIWTGSAVTPDVVVSNGQVALIPGTDYEVSYENNINETTAQSKAKVTITGKGNYKGSVVKEFVISRVLTDISTATVTAIPNQTYNFGTAVTPDVSVTFGGVKLVKNVDYRLEYSDNINVGTATVKITGVGNYNKSKDVTFNIVKADISGAEVQLKNTQFVYSGNAVTPAVAALTISSNKITDMSSFDITYKDNVNVGTATVEITAKDNSNYSGFVTTEFDIEGKSIGTALINVENAEYTGSPVVPLTTVTLDGVTLVSGRDYEMICKNNTNVTTNAIATITGKGNYTGTISASFEITAKSIENISVTIPAQSYTGVAVKPSVSLEISGYVLKENEDYTVTYTNNVNVTTENNKAAATIRGINNFAGRLVVNFDITAKNVENLTVEDIPAQEYTGSAITPAVVVKDGAATLVEGRDYDVSYSNNTGVTTDAKTIITGKGNYLGTKEITFEICRTSIASGVVTGVEKSSEYTGNAITFDSIEVLFAGVKLTKDVDYTVTYENNVNVTDNSNKAYAVVKGKGSFGGEIRCEFAITQKDISTCSIADISGQVYTGSEVKPGVTVKNGSVALKAGTDYTLSYNNNTEITTDASKATVTITGKGNYKGSVVKEFTIAREIVDISNAVISAIDDQYYNLGASVEPTIEVVYNERSLTEGVDYTVVYSNNKEVGTASVTVNAIGSNSGTISGSFRIIPLDISDADVQLASDTFTYTGNQIKPSVTGIMVKRLDEERQISNMSAFDISYSSNTEVGTATVTITAKEGRGFAGSVSKTFAITAESINTAKVNAKAMTYTGEALIPELSVTLGGRTLIAGTDYDVSASDNINATTSASYTVTGKGNYSGIVTGSFVINPKDIQNCAVEEIEAAPYTGFEIEPDVTVTDGSRTLVQDTDYSVEYNNNVTVSDAAELVITGKGNYTGTIRRNFSIIGKSISSAVITGVNDTVYSGNAITFDNVIVQLGGNTLKAGIDYEISYKNNVNVSDSAELIVTGKGNYSGTAKAVFAITPLDVSSSANVTGIALNCTYTGKPITFDGIKVTVNNKTLVAGADYSVSYNNNVNVSDEKAECIITFEGNYKGTVRKQFEILPMDIASGVIADIDDQGYTGQAVTPEIKVTVAGNKLASGDYEVAFENNVNIGTATVTVTGKGNYTGTVSTTFTIVPAKVSGLKFEYAASTTGSVKVSWNKLEGAAGYYVYMYDAVSKTYKQLADVTTNTYTVSGLKAGVTYKLAVSAYIITQDSNRLAGVKAEVNAGTLPAKVGGLRSTGRTEASITLTWSKVAGANGYRLYRYDTSTKKYVAVKTLSGNSYTVTGLNGGSSYSFSVKAYRNVDGKILWSDAATGTFVTNPLAVKGLKLVKRGTNSLRFKWKKVTGADGYYVYRYNTKTKKYTKIKTITNPAVTTFVSSKLRAGKTYTYRVCAYKKYGTETLVGKYGVFKNTTRTATPVVSVKAYSNKAVLKWRRVKGANGYRIYMSTSKNGKYKKVATVKRGRTVKYTKKSLKSGKTYYFKVRAYRTYKGKKVYSAYSTIKKVKVK